MPCFRNAKACLQERDGATAVEFAVVFPLFALVLFGGLSFGMAMLNLNTLQSVATQAARCLAISGQACTTPIANCSDTPAQCYIEQLAANDGLSNVRASQITIVASYLVGAASFTRVQITYPMSLAGYSFSLNATAQFPNG
jgi:Flp pilus assembly protein TadG